MIIHIAVQMSLMNTTCLPQFMKPVGSAEGLNTTLQEFFANRTLTETTKIELSGHSLGGMCDSFFRNIARARNHWWAWLVGRN
jgi:hypothetical protein